ncbi:MAG TPA: divalent metal cation transporter [Steroidobacteraceae bacterium]|nr:divalent metal cation transporter [Steroidobacteraceae bacterium]
MSNSVQEKDSPSISKKHPQGWLRRLGPGLITGAADDDPSGIATYSQCGAQFGMKLLWTVLLTTPLMIAIQIVSARIGVATKCGIAENMRQRFSLATSIALVTLLFIANTVNIGADIAAMTGVIQLFIKIPSFILALLLGAVTLWLQVKFSFKQYVRILKWLTLSLFTYVGIVFTVEIPWKDVLLHTVVPSIEWQPRYFTAVVAILGTTISPYLFFWQSAQEVEEHEQKAKRLDGKTYSPSASRELGRIKFDTVTGMILSNAIAFFIILTTAVTLHSRGVTDIATVAQAAEALRPVAGSFAFALFALGILGTGLLSIPILAGSAAYAWAGARNCPCGIDKKPTDAREFYLIIALAICCGVALILLPLDPIKMLFWAAVINGIISIPIMIAMIMVASSRSTMQAFTLSNRLRIFSWLTVVVVSVAVCGMVYQLFS